MRSPSLLLPRTTPLLPSPLNCCCLRRRKRPASTNSWTTGLPSAPCLRIRPTTIPPLGGSSSRVRAAVAVPSFKGVPEEEEGEEESEFIEVGYVGRAHGLQGEVRVKPSTDFPELRFCTPGRRWLRMRVLGEETISEVELTAGRSHPGQKSWILSFSGIDTVDKAKQIVGSTILVKEGDRPELEEGEFYTPDLVGMRVVFKETGIPVGTVINVVNYGASDLLQVMLCSTEGGLDDNGLPMSELDASGSIVWVPFVEAIVPVVDINKREMQIMPPKGLLELNLRSDMKSKKERRQLEWKQRKKFQQRVISAKKKLCEMGQKHILSGFSFGDKNQKRSLANQIVNINLKLFQHAMKSIGMPSKRYNELIHANLTVLLKSALQIPQECYGTFSSKDNHIHYEMKERGLLLLSESKIAIILVVGNGTNQDTVSETDTLFSGKPTSKVLQLRDILLDDNKFGKLEDRCILIPLVIISPANELQSYQELFADYDCFGFDIQKVWFLEEEKLPVVNIRSSDQNTHDILLKSPWEVLQSPVGPGRVFTLLSSHEIVDNLNEIGVEYVQVCSLDERCALGSPLLFGLVSFRGVDVGMKILRACFKDDEFDIIFSLRYLNKLTEEIHKFQLYSVIEKSSHVELLDKKFISIQPNEPNSYHFHCPIYSFLNSCPLDDICVIQIVD